MVQYRRNKIKGGTYFFTVTLKNRNSDLLCENFNLLRMSINQVKKEQPFKTKAMVILPEHIHAVWELSKGDDDYSKRWQKIKCYFTKQLLKKGYSFSKNTKGEYDLWQRRFWEHTITNDHDYENHVNYIHYNPVKHKLVNNVFEWPFSTFHWYVKNGLLEKHWGRDFQESNKSNYGE